MKKPTKTQVLLLENAAGMANHLPKNRSQSGGWNGAKVACFAKGWIDSRGQITPEGQLEIDKLKGGE